MTTNANPVSKRQTMLFLSNERLMDMPFSRRKVQKILLLKLMYPAAGCKIRKPFFPDSPVYPGPQSLLVNSK